MKTLLIFLCAVPIIVSLLVANLCGFRRLYKTTELSLDLESILKKLSARYSKIHYEFKKHTWAGIPLSKDGTALIDEEYRYSTSSKEIARQLISIGLSGLWENHQKLILRRIRYIKIGYILPPLTLLGGVLGMIVGRVPAIWVIIMLGLVLVVCISFLWFSRAVEKEAAARMVALIEQTRVLPRLSEEEELVDAIHAWTWVSILPGIAISFLMKKERRKKVS